MKTGSPAYNPSPNGTAPLPRHTERGNSTLERTVAEAVEYERRRIGRELHDHLCPKLLSASIAAKTIANQLGAGSTAASLATELAQLIDDAVGQTRGFASNVGPVNHDAGDLSDAREKTGTGAARNVNGHAFPPSPTAPREANRETIKQRPDTISGNPSDELDGDRTRATCTLPTQTMNNSGVTPPTPTKTTAKRLLIVDDHPVFRHGLSQLLAGVPGVVICGEAENAQGALSVMRELRPDIALIDVSMPGTNGIELIKLMLAEHPRLIVLILSMHDESLYALRALRAGAKGYVMKEQALDSIVEALHKVMAGGIYVSPKFSERLIFKSIRGSDSDLGSPVDTLSDRELEVLQLFGHGKTTRQIADTLHLSVKTIETHRAHIKEKLGFKQADEMVKFAVEWMTAAEG
jgi:DNA-binding NarL/FixJ family response regulator